MSIEAAQTETVYLLSGTNLGPFPTIWPYAQATGVVNVALDLGDGPVKLTSPGDFTLAAIGDGLTHGGNVTLTTTSRPGPVWPAGARLVLYRDTSVDQPSKFGEAQLFSPQSSEDALDHLGRQVQDLDAKFRRTVRYPLGQLGYTVPPIKSRVGKIWANNAAGDLVMVPPIDIHAVIAPLNYASAFIKANLNAAPCLWFNLDGQPIALDPNPAHGGYMQVVPIADGPNPLGVNTSRMVIETEWPGGDYSGGANLWCGAVYRMYDGDHAPTQNRSKFTAFFGCTNQISGILLATNPDDPSDPDWTPRIAGQECGGISALVDVDNSVTNGKGEAIVAFAREKPPIVDNDTGTILIAAGQAKLVAGQWGTVKYTQGPEPFDRNQFDDGDDAGTVKGGSAIGMGDDDNPYIAGEPQAGLATRINGAGWYRSWAACLVSGRGGFLNGFALKKPKHFGGSFQQDTGRRDEAGNPITVTVTEDRDGIHGQWGVWGGCSFIHQDTYAVYATDDCPGWVCIGHDGIATDGQSGAARSPIDIVVPDDYAGPIITVNGVEFDGGSGGAGAEMTANKGAVNGYAPLNASQLVPIANLPTGATSSTVAAGNDSRIVGAEQTANKGAAGGYAPLNGALNVPIGFLPVGTNSSSVAAGNDSRIIGAEQAANKGAANGYAPLNGAMNVPIANLPVGSNSTSVAAGNDSRIVGAEQVANKGSGNGYAPLDSGAKVPSANLPLGASGTSVAAGNDSRIVGAEQAANKGAAGGYAPLNGSSVVTVGFLPVGTNSTSVAAGNDSRIVGAAQVGGANTFVGRQTVPILNIGARVLHTIATDTITLTASNVKLDTEAAASTDNLSTINGGVEGDVIILCTTSAARVVTVKDSVGNINLGADRVIDSLADRLVLTYAGGNWFELSFANNA